MEKPQVIDRTGKVQTWAWLVTNFGDVQVERCEVPAGQTHAYRIVKLQDTEGPAAQVVNVLAQNGNPIEGINVVRHWPDAPDLPAWSPPISLWRKRGVFGQTNINGDIGYGMGHGDYYFPPAGGASAIWVADSAGPSDLISGLGMLGGTNHRHLDVYYQLVPVEAPPPVEPPVEPPVGPGEPPDELWQQLFAKLDQIIQLLEQKVGG